MRHFSGTVGKFINIHVNFSEFYVPQNINIVCSLRWTYSKIFFNVLVYIHVHWTRNNVVYSGQLKHSGQDD